MDTIDDLLGPSEAASNQDETVDALLDGRVEPQPTQGAIKGALNKVGQQYVRGVGNIAQGVATLIESGPQPVPRGGFEPPESFIEYEPPAQTVKAIQSNPLYQFGKSINKAAPEAYPVSPANEKKVLTKVGGVVGDFIPLIASGPLAPATVGVQSMGSHLENDFQTLKDQGLSDDEAAQKTLDRALLSGVTQSALFAILPGPLKKLGEKYLVSKASGKIAEFAAKRLAESAEGATLFGASHVAENAIAEQPLTQGLGESLAAGALINPAVGAITAGVSTAKTARERGKKLRSLQSYKESPGREAELERRRQSVESNDITDEIMRTANRPTTEEQNASAIRSNQAVNAEEGQVAQGGENERGQNLELPSPGQPEPVAQRAEAQAAPQVSPQEVAAPTGFTYDASMETMVPNAWHFTDRRPDSPTRGLSVAVAKGSPPEALQEAITKRAEGYTPPTTKVEEIGSPLVVPPTPPTEVAPREETPAPPAAPRTYQPGQSVYVRLSDGQNKLHKAKVLQVQPVNPDGTGGEVSVRFIGGPHDKVVRSLKPNLVQRPGNVVSRELNETHYEGMDAQDKRDTKDEAREFVNIVREAGPMFGWYQDIYEGSERKGIDMMANDLLKKGVAKAFKAAGIPGDPENPIDRSKGIHRLKEFVGQKNNFETATSSGKQGITPDELVVGDVLDIEGEQVHVTAKNDRTGEVTLDDGRKFGTQKVEGGHTIYVEDVTQKAGGEPSFEPTPEAPKVVPKLRANEKGTGDLLQGEDAPFNLAGEKATDFERLAKEKADKEAASKAAKEAADKAQLDIFESKPDPDFENLFYGDVFGTVKTIIHKSKFGDYGSAIYLTPDRDFARQFAEGTAFSSAPKGSGKIHSVRVNKPKNIFKADETPLTDAEKKYWTDSGESMEGVNTRSDLIENYGGRAVGQFDLRDISDGWDGFVKKFGYDAVWDRSQLAVYNETAKIKPADAENLSTVKSSEGPKSGGSLEGAPPARVAKFRVGNNPQTHTLVERLPQDAAERENNEHPVRVRNDKTGEEQVVMESDLTPLKERTAEEREASRGKTKQDLRDELLQLRPDLRNSIEDFKTKEELRAQIKREKAKRGEEPQPNLGGGLAEGQGLTLERALDATAKEDTAGFNVNVVTGDEAVKITGRKEAKGYAGFFWKGEAYLVHDNIADAEEARQVHREEVGHGLLRTKAGLKLLQEAIDAGKLNLTEAERKTLTDEGYLENNILDEFIAKSARENRSWWKKAVERVRQWLSKVGLADLTNEETARLLLQNIRRSVKNGSTENLPGERLVTKNAVITAPGVKEAPAITAHHGTPHKIEGRFSTEKIGTGEGAQVYGWGLYFADRPEVATQYRKNLAGNEKYKTVGIEPTVRVRDYLDHFVDAGSPVSWIKEDLDTNRLSELRRDELDDIRKFYDYAVKHGYPTEAGNEYAVSLEAEPNELLDWDRPLSESELGRELQRKASEVLKGSEQTNFDPMAPKATGDGLYNALSRHFSVPVKETKGWTSTLNVVLRGDEPIGSDKAASAWLKSQGIPGIRYLDQGSRGVPDVARIESQIEDVKKRIADIKNDPELDLSGRGFSALVAAKEQELLGLKKELREANSFKRTFNYVIFDDSKIRITHENGKQVPVSDAIGRSQLPDLAPAISKLRQAVRQFPEAEQENRPEAERNIRLGQAGEAVGRSRVAQGAVRTLEEQANPATQPTTARGRMERDIARRALSNPFLKRAVRIPVATLNESRSLVGDTVATFEDVKENPASTPEEISAAAGNALNAYREFERQYTRFDSAYSSKRAELTTNVRRAAEGEMRAMEYQDRASVLLNDLNDLAGPLIRQTKDKATLDALSIVTDRNRTTAVRNVMRFIADNVEVEAMSRAGIGNTQQLIAEIRRRGGDDYNARIGASDEVVASVARVLAHSEPIRERLQQAQNITWLKGQNEPFNRYKTRIVEAILSGNYERAMAMFTRTTQKAARAEQKFGDAASFYGRRTKAALESLQALDRVKGIADEIKNDPTFKEEQKQVYDHLNVRDVLYDHRGTSIVFKPLHEGGEELTVTFGNDSRKTNEALAQLSRYKQEALALLGDEATSPEKANAIRATLPAIDNLLDPSLRPEAARLTPNYLYMPIRNIYQLFAKWIFGDRPEQIPYYVLQGAGGPAAAISDASLNALRTMSEQRQRIFATHEGRLKKTLDDALQSHGGISPEVYRSRVWNLLAGSRQNFNDTRKMTVGTPIGNGEVVTAADLEYLRAYGAFHGDFHTTINSTANQNFSSFKKVLTGILYDSNQKARLPFAQGSETLPRKKPDDLRDWLKNWRESKTQPEQVEFLNRNLDPLVMGYVDGISRADWNGKFGYSYGNELRQIVSEFREHPLQSFDDLVERVTEKHNENLEGDAEPVSREEVEQALVGDFDKIFKRLEVYDSSNKPADPKRDMDVFGGDNEFNTERGNLIMPPGWYDYGGVTDADWSSVGTKAMQPFYMAHLTAMEQLSSAMTDIVKGFEAEGRARGNSKVKGESRKARLAGDLIYSWGDAVGLANEVAAHLSKLRRIVEAPHLMTVGDRPQVVMTNGLAQIAISSILTPPQTLLRNYGGKFHGVMADKLFRDMMFPVAMARHGATALRDGFRGVLNLISHQGNPAGRAVHKLLSDSVSAPIVGRFAQAWLDAVNTRNDLYQTGAEIGLNLNRNLNDALAGMQRFKTTAGQAKSYEPQSAVTRLLNRGSTKLRQAAKAIAQAGVGKVDANLNVGALSLTSNFEQHWKRVAQKFGPIIEQLAQSEGRDPFNWEDKSNQLPSKAFASKWFGNEQRALVIRNFLRRSAGVNIDKAILDYYRRWKDASPEDKDKVNLFTQDEYNELAIANAENINLATFSNRPTATKLSSGHSMAGLLMGYSDWTLHKYLATLNTSSREGRLSGIAKNLPYLLTVGVPAMAAAALIKDAYERVKNLLMNRYGSFPTISQARTPGAAARAVLAASADELNVYGTLAWNLFNLGYQKKLTINDQLFVMGALGDIANTAKEVYETHDAVRPTLALLGRYVVPFNLGINRIPLFAGSQELSNAKNLLKNSVRGSGDDELLKEPAGIGEVKYTLATPFVNRAMNAIGNGDMEEFQKQFAEIVRVKAEEGQADPEAAARKLISARNPVASVFKKLPDPAQLESYISSLPSGQQEIVRKAIENYQQAASLIGLNVSTANTGSRGGSGGGSSGGGDTASSSRSGGLSSTRGLVGRLKRPRLTAGRSRRAGLPKARLSRASFGQRRPKMRRLRMPRIKV